MTNATAKTPIEKLLPEIQQAAKKTARDWNGIISADDAEQEIVIRLLEDAYAEKLLSFDQNARTETLEKIGRQIASDYRTDYDHFTGNFFYSTNDVREILERGALHEERDSTNTERLDLDEGMALLKKRNFRYSTLIRSRYLFGIEPGNETDARATRRAVDLLTDCMNNVHRNREIAYSDGMGSREIISRQRAWVIAQKQYSGDSPNAGNIADRLPYQF